MSSSPPLVVADRYRLVAPLGQGGMGRVWRATDVVLHRDVAIKELVPPPGLTPGERQEMRERSLREARAIARLNNVNVVRVFDVLRTDADPWIVMEYVESRSLQDTLASDGPFGPVRAAEIGLGVLGALRAAHRAGVVHRDVKPGNVLMGADGRVVLTDFGLATVPGDPNVTRTGLVLGSPAYIAPERARDGSAGPAADLWSLGATLYAAVEGASPFARPSAIATLAALATENPPPARNAGALKPVLNGLLRKDPAHRINAEETERLLLRAAGRRSKLTFPMSPTMRRPGVGRERPALPGGPGSLASAGAAPVVPGPRPPVAPARSATPPGHVPVSPGQPATGKGATGNGRPPVYVPGKAPVGRPAESTPRTAEPDADATRLDATRVDSPAVQDDKTKLFGTRRGSSTAPGRSATTPVTPAAAAPSSGLTSTNRGEQASFSAADVAAHRRGQTAPDQAKPRPDATALLPPTQTPTTPSTEPAENDGPAPAAVGGTVTEPETAPAAIEPVEPVEPVEPQELIEPAQAGPASAEPVVEVPPVAAPNGTTAEATAPPPDNGSDAAMAMSASTATSPAEGAPAPTDIATPAEAAPATEAVAPGKDSKTARANAKTGKSAKSHRRTPAPAPAEPTADAQLAADAPLAVVAQAAAEAEAQPTTNAGAETTATDETALPAGTTAPADVPGTDVSAAEDSESQAQPDPGTTDNAAVPPARPRIGGQRTGGSTESSAGPARTEPAIPDDNAPVSPILGQLPARPAWRPMDAVPSQPGVTVFGTRLTYRQAAVGAGILLIILILVITLVAQGFGDDDRKATGTKPAPVPSAATQGSAAPSAAATSAQPTSQSPSAAPSVAPTSAPAAPGQVKLPAGWKWYREKATSSAPAFTIPVPNGADVSSAADGEMHFQWNNRLLIVGRTDSPQPDVKKDWENQEDARKGGYRNYKLLKKIDYVSYPGFKRAADWEFLYTTDGGNDQHVVKRNVAVSDKAAYSLNWYTSPGDWAAAQSQLKLIYQGFQPK